MKTYTFYSYKGGTGRSLLLSNCAHYLALLGHRVVALDFDLEAPGLHFKLSSHDPEGTSADGVPGKGVVDYLLDSAQGRPTDELLDYLVSVPLPKSVRGKIHLMPAGAAPSGDYWRALTHLLRRDFFADPEGVGIAACLELKARIEEELKADFLLIDSRTGVTELAGVTTTVLADKVVCLMLANRESQSGARAVLRSLGRAPRLPGQPPIEVIPVLSRVPELDEVLAKETLDFLNEPGSTPEDSLALESAGLRPRLPPNALTFPSDSARVNAGDRARVRLNRTLEELVMFELEASPGHRKRLYSDILSVVRSGSTLQNAVLVGLGDLADEEVRAPGHEEDVGGA